MVTLITFLTHSAYDIYAHKSPGQYEIQQVNEYGAQYEAPHTTYNYKKGGSTIDYIWYSDHLKLVGLLELPSVEELQSESGPIGWVDRVNEAYLREGKQPKILDPSRNNNGIPNSKFSSDHIPILASFRYQSDKSYL